MIDVLLLKNRIAALADDLAVSREAVDLVALQKRIDELSAQQLEDGFYNDRARVAKVASEQKRAQDKLDRFLRLQKALEDNAELVDLLEAEGEQEMLGEVQTAVDGLEVEISALHVETLLGGEFDSHNAYVSIHAGAGGTEAQDWASMLYRMYRMFCDKQGYKIGFDEVLEGDEAGIKGVTFLVEGENAYGYLRAEKGVHRLVRISPFDSNARRHTSFASVEVMPEIGEEDAEEIRAEDLKIDTFRSGGAGGQHVNKTESAIRITHIPSGIVVACQNERSQIQNRETAMGMLRARLAEKRDREQQERLSDIQGALKKIEWGSQIRSYVFAPYTMVKDHRTGHETSNVAAVMNGDIFGFIERFLQLSCLKNKE